MAGPFLVRLSTQDGKSYDVAVREAENPLAAYSLAAKGLAEKTTHYPVAWAEVFRWPDGVPFPKVWEDYAGLGAKMGVRVEDTLDRFKSEWKGFKWYVREHAGGRRTIVRKSEGLALELTPGQVLESYYSDENPLCVPGSAAQLADELEYGDEGRTAGA